MNYLRRLTLLRLIFLMCSSLVVTGATAAEELDPTVVRQSLDSIDFQTFVAGFRNPRALDEAIRQVSRQRARLLVCVTRKEKALADLTTAVGKEALDELRNKEQKSIEEIRVTNEAGLLSDEAQECKLLLDQAVKLQEKLTEHQLEINKQKLFERQPHLGRSLIDGFPALPTFISEALGKQGTLPTIKLSAAAALSGGLGTLLLLAIGFGVRRRAVAPEIDSTASFSSQFTTAISFMARRWAPLLLPLIFAVVFMVFVVGYQFTHSNLNRLLIFGLSFTVFQIVLRAGVRRYTRYLHDTQKIDFPGQALYLRLLVASCLLGAWLLLVVITGARGELAQGEALFRLLLSICILLSLIELARFLARIPHLPRIASIGRLVSTIAFFISLILACVGYQNLSLFIWGGIVLSAISLTIFYVIEKFQRDFYDGIEGGGRYWQKRFRKVMSVGDDEPVPGLIWFRVLSICALWIALLVGVLKAWGTPNSGIAALFDLARNGFKVGDTLLTPINVVIGVLMFAILLMMFRWFRDGLDKKYLSKSRMDSGAREAMVTIIGYVGFVIAALAGLSIAGVGFGNLAIVAGALSLGIGFGLQNIVNNFVSGIILLFERPIKTGDWIVTGSTEGYVKKIRVRSTEVQTFNRSDVIVPNSELISTQVTNWTLRDKYGRVIVPVGVAYGSDTALVKKLLLKVAEDTPQIIKNRPTLPVKVLFLGFGDSTLNFELRGFIFDIGTIIDVRSDLHFAIDAIFREHSVEIAFPQRDIHIRSGVLPDPSVD